MWMCGCECTCASWGLHFSSVLGNDVEVFSLNWLTDKEIKFKLSVET